MLFKSEQLDYKISKKLVLFKKTPFLKVLLFNNIEDDVNFRSEFLL